MNTLELGARICKWRTLWGFSQRELARRADITNGTLSQIEQSKTSPAVQTVEKIADAFGLSLQMLMFEEPFAPVQVKTEGFAPLIPIGAATAGVYDFPGDAPVLVRMHIPISSVVTNQDVANTISHAVDLQQSQMPKKWLRFYVVNGEVVLRVAGQTLTLLAGDVACVFQSQTFSLLAEQSAATELLIVFPA